MYSIFAKIALCLFFFLYKLLIHVLTMLWKEAHLNLKDSEVGLDHEILVFIWIKTSVCVVQNFFWGVWSKKTNKKLFYRSWSQQKSGFQEQRLYKIGQMVKKIHLYLELYTHFYFILLLIGLTVKVKKSRSMPKHKPRSKHNPPSCHIKQK